MRIIINRVIILIGKPTYKVYGNGYDDLEKVNGKSSILGQPLKRAIHRLFEKYDLEYSYPSI